MITSSDYIQLCGFKNHPMANKNGVITEHRFIMSNHLGRNLSKNEIVHHINGNTKDNRIENLKLVTSKDHFKEHHIHPEKQWLNLICAFCKKKFKLERRNFVFKSKNGQKDFYCSRTCMAGHFGNGRKKT
jgi:hypothetical protein